jgi:hypothetical protein
MGRPTRRLAPGSIKDRMRLMPEPSGLTDPIRPPELTGLLSPTTIYHLYITPIKHTTIVHELQTTITANQKRAPGQGPHVIDIDELEEQRLWARR